MIVGLVLRLACSMTVTRVAIDTASPHIDRPKAFESTFGVGVVVLLEEVFTLIEGGHHACVLHGLRRLLVGCGSIVSCRSKLSAGIVILVILGRRWVANVPSHKLCRAFIVGTSDEKKGNKDPPTPFRGRKQMFIHAI